MKFRCSFLPCMFRAREVIPKEHRYCFLHLLCFTSDGLFGNVASPIDTCLRICMCAESRRSLSPPLSLSLSF